VPEEDAGAYAPRPAPVRSSAALNPGNSLAAEHQIDMALLATSADLQEFVRWRLGLTEEAPPQLIDGWRGEILGQPLIELLEGTRVIRVADGNSPKPLRKEIP
jgi:ribonuclease D